MRITTPTRLYATPSFFLILCLARSNQTWKGCAFPRAFTCAFPGQNITHPSRPLSCTFSAENNITHLFRPFSCSLNADHNAKLVFLPRAYRRSARHWFWRSPIVERFRVSRRFTHAYPGQKHHPSFATFFFSVCRRSHLKRLRFPTRIYLCVLRAKHHQRFSTSFLHVIHGFQGNATKHDNTTDVIVQFCFKPGNYSVKDSQLTLRDIFVFPLAFILTYQGPILTRLSKPCHFIGRFKKKHTHTFGYRAWKSARLRRIGNNYNILTPSIGNKAQISPTIVHLVSFWSIKQRKLVWTSRAN